MNTITLPVVAHRIYGVGYSSTGTVWGDTPSSPEEISNLEDERILSSKNLVGGPNKREIRSFERIIETYTPSSSREMTFADAKREVRYVASGTRREIEEIRDFFDAGHRAKSSGDEHVNQIWSEAGIQFQLVAIVDHGLPAFQSLFIDADKVKKVVRDLNTPKVVNVYFFRDLIGALGVAQSSVRPVSNGYWKVPFAAVEDWEQAHRNWRYAVRVLAHELGHLLSLSHLEDVDNLMYPWDNDRSRDFVSKQIVIARNHAKQYSENTQDLCVMDSVFRKHFERHSSGPVLIDAGIKGAVYFGE